jgi:hypothetical protein
MNFNIICCFFNHLMHILYNRTLHILPSFLLPLKLLVLYKYILFQIMSHLSKYIVNNKVSQSLVSSTWLSNLHQPISLISSTHTILLRSPSFCRRDCRCTLTFDGGFCIWAILFLAFSFPQLVHSQL